MTKLRKPGVKSGQHLDSVIVLHLLASIALARTLRTELNSTGEVWVGVLARLRTVAQGYSHNRHVSILRPGARAVYP